MIKEIRYCLKINNKNEFKFPFIGVKNDKYMRNGNRYRQVTNNNGELDYWLIEANQSSVVDKTKVKITQNKWENTVADTYVFAKMYKSKDGAYCEHVTVNGKSNFWSTETENEEDVKNLKVLEDYFDIKNIGEKSLLDIAKSIL